ncbi:polysaccharide deacetylase [Ochrobactrum quorumnocens]|uniref:polysaccharide deacetylase family protein n=1 Tax=Ochrobactrum quorumnocens TaxID=271865 RepID=UPI003853251D
MRLITPAVIIASALAASSVVAETKKPQYVLISFDGAHDNKLWTRSRELAKNNNAHFTYFLSCVFLMTKKDRRDYQPPHKRAGSSNVGFALSDDEVVTRLDNIWQAHLEGNEIASHGCGHFDGTNWSTADWDKEIREFRRITADAYKNNGIEGEPDGWQELARKGINGFRAPYLAASKPVQDALKTNGFRYQASSITRGPELPQINSRFASFGLPLIPEGPSQRVIVGMDYNLYVRHSKGKEAPAQSAEFEERAYKAFRAAFDTQYEGERIPLQLGFHFVLMNDGAYWRAMERLVSEVCNKPDVKCTTYNDYLNSTDSPSGHATQNRS